MAEGDGTQSKAPAPPRANPLDVLRTALEQAAAAVRRSLQWYREHPLLAAICAVVGFGVAWLVNTAVMALKYDGYVVAQGSAAAGKGNVFWGAMLWALLPGLVAAVVVYIIQVGPRQALAQLKSTPTTVAGAFRLDRHAPSHALAGYALGCIVPLIGVPVVSGALAGWMAFVLVTRLRRLAMSLSAAVWRFAFERLAGRPADHVGPAGSLVGLAGALGALVVGWLVPSTAIILLSALVAGGVAVGLTKTAAASRTTAASTATIVLAVVGVAGLVAVVVLGDAAPLAADDGGYIECGRPGLFGWLTDCGGSGRLILQSMLFGGPSGFLGGLFGSGVGGGASGPGEDDPYIPGTGCSMDGPTPMSPEREELLKWRAVNPDAPVTDFWEHKQRVEEFRRWEQEPDDPFYSRWWRDFGRFNEEVGKALWEDYESGSMGDRLTRMPKHVLPSLAKSAKNMVVGLAAQTKEMADSGGPSGYMMKKGKQGFDMMVDHGSVMNEVDRLKDAGVSPEAIKVYVDAQLDDLAQKYPEVGMSKALIDGMNKYADASLSGDNETVAKMTVEIFAELEVMAVSGRAQAAGMTRMTTPKTATATAPKGTQPTSPAHLPDPKAPPRSRSELMALADEHGTVRITPDEARELGLEPILADDLWDHHLRWGGHTEFKLGTPENVAMRETGQYQPKPGCYEFPDGTDAAAVLVKSINETDVAINPSLAGKERIVSFVDGPEPPPGTPEHSRWTWRQQERVDLAESMEVLKTKGGIKIDENGKPVPYWVDEMPDGTLVDRTTGKQFIPDNDTFTSNPGRLTPEQHQSSLYKLGRETIQHPGDTPNWHFPKDDPDFAYKTKVKEKVIADVEKEGRVRIDADGPKFCKNPSGRPSSPPGPTTATPTGAGPTSAAPGQSSAGAPTAGTSAAQHEAAGAAASGVAQAHGGAPPGYESQDPASGGAPAGYYDQAPGSGNAPPGYDSPAPGSGGAPPGYYSGSE